MKIISPWFCLNIINVKPTKDNLKILMVADHFRKFRIIIKVLKQAGQIGIQIWGRENEWAARLTKSNSVRIWFSTTSYKVSEKHPNSILWNNTDLIMIVLRSERRMSVLVMMDSNIIHLAIAIIVALMTALLIMGSWFVRRKR